MSLISQNKFAGMQGVSRQRINRLVKEGRITLIRGKIDPVRAQAELEETIDQVKRFDYEYSVPSVPHFPKREKDGPPYGLTGNPFKDLPGLCLGAFFENYVTEMTPVLLKIFGELFHCDQTTSKVLVFMWAGTTMDRFENFIRQDKFNQAFEGSLDDLWARCIHKRISTGDPRIVLSLPQCIRDILQDPKVQSRLNEKTPKKSQMERKKIRHEKNAD